MKTLLKILVACILVAGVGQTRAFGHGSGHSGGRGGFAGHGWHGGFGHGGFAHGGFAHGGFGRGWYGRGWGGWGWGWGLGWPYCYGGYYPGYYYPGYCYPGYGYPAYSYGAPAYSYGAPAYSYGAPAYGYRGGRSVPAQVQAALSSRGYSTGGVDGVIGPQSRSAIRRYQSEHGLPTTGDIDQPLLHSLRLG